MSREVVVRVGTGPLHIRTPGVSSAICGRRLPADVTTWRAGKEARAIWAAWRHCGMCSHLNDILSR